MSDEAAKRRELRRLKILANSESRLRRILNNEEGRASGDEPASPSSPSPEQNAEVIATPFEPLLTSAVSEAEAQSGVGSNHRPRSKPSLDTENLRQSSQTTEERISSLNSAPQFPQQHSTYNPITNMDFSDIPVEELALFGPSPDDFEAFRQDSVSRLGNGFAGGPLRTAEFDSAPFAQLLSSLASSSNDSTLCTLAKVADSFKVPQPHRAEGAGASGTSDRLLYQILWDPCCLLRILLIVMLAVLARFTLPFFPSDYAVMFAPLYFLEVLLLSLCIICSVPLDRSKMAFAFNLLLMFGAPKKTVRFSHTLVACVETFFRDLSTYTFAFFMTHALCQHAGVTVT